MWVGNGRQQIQVRVKGAPTPIGSVDVHYDKPGKAFISDLEVNQSHRRHGVATMLMKAAMESARRNGSTATELEARPGPGSISNQALLGMYTKLGYKNKGISQRGNPRLEKSSPTPLQRKTASAQAAVQRKPHQGPVSKIIQLMEDDQKEKNPYAKPRLSFKPVDKRTARQIALAGEEGGAAAVARPNYVPPKDSKGNKIWDGARGSLSWNSTITAAMALSKGGGCQLGVSPNCTGAAEGIDHNKSFAAVQAGFERYEICDGRNHWAAVYKDDADAGFNNNSKTEGLCWSCTKCNSKKNGAKGLYENAPKWLGPCQEGCSYVFKGEPSGQ
jgi:Acetyltransferase (GNAT) family